MNIRHRLGIIGNILRDSVWNTLNSKIVSSITVIVTVSGWSIKEFNTDSDLFDWLNWVYTTCFILVILVARVLWVAAGEIHEASYCETNTLTHARMAKYFRELADYANKLINGDITPSKALGETCNKMREFFDKLTNSHCCVSIKLIEGNSDGSYDMTLEEIANHRVHNVARDGNHKTRDTEQYNNTEHLIRENTAFYTIIGSLRNPKRRFYINNNVELSNSYLTTSPYTNEEGVTEIPYKSELVFPIMKELEAGKFSFIGFLCIDSDIKDAFQTGGPGIEANTMMAQILYWIFTKYEITQ